MKQSAMKFFTLIIVPHASSRLHKVRVPVRGIWVLALAGCLSSIAAAGLGWRYVRMTFELTGFNALQAENRELKIEEKNLEISTKKLNAQIKDVEALSQEVASLAETTGIVKKTARPNGIGGSAVDRSTDDLLGSATPEPDVDSLKARADKLQSQMANLHQEMGLRISRARVTPDIWPLKG